ncbi:ribonuclease H-like domain-containing protein [Tanacetum coccineum]
MSNDESVKEPNFDHFESEPATKIPLSPNDDEEGSPGIDGSVHQPVFGTTTDQPGHDDLNSATPIGEQSQSEGNVGINLEVPSFLNDFPNTTEEVGPKRSQRPSKLPAKLNEFVLEDKVNAMNDEMYALYENKTWFMIDLPISTKLIGCKWVFRIKYKSNGEVKRYKARLLAKGFSQKEGIDYEETFSPMVKMSIFRCLINLVVQKDWKVYQMDVNNAFLYGDLNEEVYMLPPLGFFKYGETKLCSDVNEIEVFKRPVMTPFLENIVLSHKESDTDKFLLNTTNYQKLVRKLIYLTHTRPDISYSVHCLSQHMHAPLKSHFDIAMRVLKYLKLAPKVGVDFSKRKSDCLITAFFDSDWGKFLVNRISVSGYMASTTCKVMWVVKVLQDFSIDNLIPVNLYCDNKSAIQIAANPVMHEKLSILTLMYTWLEKSLCNFPLRSV